MLSTSSIEQLKANCKRGKSNAVIYDNIDQLNAMIADIVHSISKDNEMPHLRYDKTNKIIRFYRGGITFIRADSIDNSHGMRIAGLFVDEFITLSPQQLAFLLSKVKEK